MSKSVRALLLSVTIATVLGDVFSKVAIAVTLPVTPENVVAQLNASGYYPGEGRFIVSSGVNSAGSFSGFALDPMILSGTFDTSLLTVDNLSFSPNGVSFSSSVFATTSPYLVTNTVTTIIPGGGPFDPPTIIEDVTEFGVLSLEASVDYSITLTPAVLPTSLSIDSVELETPLFALFSMTIDVTSIEIKAFVDGFETAQATGSSSQHYGRSSGRYACGGIIPDAHCDLTNFSTGLTYAGLTFRTSRRHLSRISQSRRCCLL